MNGPTLLIMAAGLGSRFGGMKQIAPLDPEHHIIMDFSIYDAMRAGFSKVVLIIKEEHRQDFDETIGARVAGQMPLYYAYQKPDTLPEGFTVPEGRVKPWGTAHAVLSAYDLVNGPFAVINADDYYGREAMEAIGAFLSQPRPGTKHAMVGYPLSSTLTESGYVSRGVCQVDGDGHLVGITERTHIESRADGPAYTEDGETYVHLPPGTVVSMNLWGFQRDILDLFAGTGQLGIEALSRGAARCTFVDQRKDAAALVRENLKLTGLTGQGKVVQGDSISYLMSCREKFHVIFLDPPYQSGLLEQAMETIAAFDILREHGIMICESPLEQVLPDLSQPYERGKDYRYGKIKLTVYRRNGGERRP